MKVHYKTIVISDLHLGIRSSKAKEVTKFLKKHSCDTLILNGDIIDGWALKRSGQWKKQHTKFFQLIFKYVSNRKTKVVYLRGNHDDFLNEVLPFELGNFSICKHYMHESLGRKYFVTHGDLFDSVTSKMRWLARLGDVGYTFLLWLNRHYNTYREKRGLPYYSLSQAIKAKVKQAVSFISDFENELAKVAKRKKCDGIICGHIHQAADKMIDGIHYLNSGDWVETLSALVETQTGEWKVVHYEEWMASYRKKEVELDKEIKKIKLLGIYNDVSTVNIHKTA